MISEKAFTFLDQCIKTSTQGRLEKYCQELPITLTELERPRFTLPYGEEMSIIQIWGSVVSMNLKIHFNLDVARAWASRALGLPPERISDEAARDFMKEFSNVQAGHLRGLFENCGVLMGMSLPFLANGEDEFIFKKLRDPRARTKVLQLSDGKNEVTCTYELVLLESTPFDRIMEQYGDDAASLDEKFNDAVGDVEFM